MLNLKKYVIERQVENVTTEMSTPKVDRRAMGERKRRRRHPSSDAEADQDDSGMPVWKTAVVLGIVAVCFAMLYPKIFQPLLTQLFFGSSQQKPIHENHPREFYETLFYDNNGKCETDLMISARHPHPAMRHGAPDGLRGHVSILFL